MPLVRYWECTRYYRYFGDKRKDWRAFEVRAIIPFPADWTEDDVKRYLRDLETAFDNGLISALGDAFPDSESRDRLVDVMENRAESGWGKLPRRIDATPTTGLEPSEETEDVDIRPRAEIERELSELKTEVSETRERMLELRPVLREPELLSIAPIEWRTLRGKIGALSRERRKLRKESPEREIEMMAIDKTKRYSTQFPERVPVDYPAYRTTTFFWRIPFEEE